MNSYNSIYYSGRPVIVFNADTGSTDAHHSLACIRSARDLGNHPPPPPPLLLTPELSQTFDTHIRIILPKHLLTALIFASAKWMDGRLWRHSRRKFLRTCPKFIKQDGRKNLPHFSMFQVPYRHGYYLAFKVCTARAA